MHLPMARLSLFQTSRAVRFSPFRSYKTYLFKDCGNSALRRSPRHINCAKIRVARREHHILCRFPARRLRVNIFETLSPIRTYDATAQLLYVTNKSDGHEQASSRVGKFSNLGECDIVRWVILSKL